VLQTTADVALDFAKINLNEKNLQLSKWQKYLFNAIQIQTMVCF